MDNIHIQPVSPGQKVQAETINQLIDSTDFSIKATGARVHVGKDVNMQVNDQGQQMFSGQKFREPFDLSVGRTGSGIAVEVVRSHLPNTHGGLDAIPPTTISFPTDTDVEIYLCELSNGQRCLLSSDDHQLSAAQSKTLMWSFLSNGVVAEDCRIAALGGASAGHTLDMSSLNWVKVSSEVEIGGETQTVWTNTTSAQLWDYNRLEDSDIVDAAGLTASPGYMFPVRPPDGSPHLQYTALSALSSAVGGGGGGGHCSCDLSVTPPATLSSLGQDLVQIADWTKDNWQTHTPILAPDVAKDVVQLFQWMAMTPFWYNEPTHQIRNNYFYNGRAFMALADFTVSNEGYYYLKIEDNMYGVAPSFTIVRSDTAPNAIQNTDTTTYYPIWTINSGLKAQFDWRLTWMLPRYSN